METKDKHIFYVLKCADNTLYAGYTTDLERRVAQHNSGKGAKYTRTRTPVHCVYYETYETKTEAMQKEYAFKQLNRKEKLKYIGRENHEISKK